MIKPLLRNNILTHLFFVSLFLILPTIAFVRPPGEPFFPMSRVFLQDTVANCVLLAFFYLNYYVLVPELLLSKKYFLYTFYVILFLGLALSLPRLIGRTVTSNPNDLPFRQNNMRGLDRGGPRNNSSLIYFIFLEFRRHLHLFFTAVFFALLLRTREHLSQLREEKLEAELTSLKAQINPHFLFNTLNSIYALSVKKDDKASEAIINLSGLMRYVIKDANGYKIPLHKEIDYITNYIELQKARLGNTAAVNFDCSGDPGDMEITPLILITYIENAFKYGVNPDVDGCVVGIKIQVMGTGLQLKTFNKKVHSIANPDSIGIGMKNTSERLNHLYPGNHSFQVTENDQTYSITLSLELV